MVLNDIFCIVCSFFISSKHVQNVIEKEKLQFKSHLSPSYLYMILWHSFLMLGCQRHFCFVLSFDSSCDRFGPSFWPRKSVIFGLKKNRVFPYCVFVRQYWVLGGSDPILPYKKTKLLPKRFFFLKFCLKK